MPLEIHIPGWREKKKDLGKRDMLVQHTFAHMDKTEGQNKATEATRESKQEKKYLQYSL